MSAEDARRELAQLLRSRRSVRAFRPEPLGRDLVLRVLSLASTAPSNSNTQPWRVHVLAGAHKDALSAELLAAHEADALADPAHFPHDLPDAQRAHQEQFGRVYYAALGIDRADAAARKRQTGRNYAFFGAPVGLLFSIDRRLTAHSWLDCGLFIQNVMIAARIHGLDSCPQVSLARCQSIIAKHVDLGEHGVVVCGMSLGHADVHASVNAMRMPREPVGRFATLLGFDEATALAQTSSV